MTKYIILLFLAQLCSLSFGQRPIDVNHYYLSIGIINVDDHLEDYVSGSVYIDLTFTQDTDSFSLDLVSMDEEGNGMLVGVVGEDDEELKFEQVDDKLIIHTKNGNVGEKHRYTIMYGGNPKDGLIIGKNKHGNKTYFSDNWPNRAHHWFPCVDHPSDKATLKIMVVVDPKYNVVSNGVLTREETLESGMYMAEYTSKYPLPTKVMVIGIAKLVSQELENDHGIPHYNWVYPEDEIDGFNDMKVASDPLDFFIKKIGFYPFDKLFNVQSTTRFGGMENAGCIFYDENAITGKGTMENLIAHEIAHQWFGNSATEADWPHLWLSEGFATYFTNLYLEEKYGREKMNTQLIKDRARVIRFSKGYQTPVVDTISTDLMYLLNPNSYQKGSWILHMLRYKIGDTDFWDGIRAYYDRYKYGNATTNDFMRIMEEVSKTNLEEFFSMWLRRPGHPRLYTWTETTSQGDHRVRIEQYQPNIFQFPLTIRYELEDGSIIEMEHLIDKKMNQFVISNELKVISFEIDPYVNLLFEEVKQSEL